LGSQQGFPQSKIGNLKSKMGSPWAVWDGTNPEIRKVADRFIFANAYNPQAAAAARSAG